MYRMEEEGYDGHVADSSSMAEVVAKKARAMEKSYEWGDRIPTGIFYQARMRTYEEELSERLPRYASEPLINWDVTNRDVSKLLESFR